MSASSVRFRLSVADGRQLERWIPRVNPVASSSAPGPCVRLARSGLARPCFALAAALVLANAGHPATETRTPTTAGSLARAERVTAPPGLTPAQAARLAIRAGKHRGTSRGLAMGYVQCNLVIVPQAQ